MRLPNMVYIQTRDVISKVSITYQTLEVRNLEQLLITLRGMVWLSGLTALCYSYSTLTQKMGMLLTICIIFISHSRTFFN